MGSKELEKILENNPTCDIFDTNMLLFDFIYKKKEEIDDNEIIKADISYKLEKLIIFSHENIWIKNLDLNKTKKLLESLFLTASIVILDKDLFSRNIRSFIGKVLEDKQPSISISLII